VPSPPVETPGRTVAERRVFAIGDPDVDRLRRILCHEPRGHADMYGGLLVPPDDDGARLGVLFFHKDAFSTACGHGTIALGAWAVRSGLVPARAEGTVDVPIDVPSGRVAARVHTTGGRVTAVDFVSVPSFLVTESITVATSRGPVRAAVSYGGALYAQVEAAAVGLAVTPERLPDLIALGREVKVAQLSLLEIRRLEPGRHDALLSGDSSPDMTTEMGPGLPADIRFSARPCGQLQSGSVTSHNARSAACAGVRDLEQPCAVPPDDG
jgi:proline racemase/trans-L-3-hydroxyproline dehydratase